MIWLPGSGILQVYTDPSTSELTDEFNQALAMYLFAWMILTFIYAVAAVRSTWVLVIDLVVLDIEFLLLACGYMANNSSLLVGGIHWALLSPFSRVSRHSPWLCSGADHKGLLLAWAATAGLWNGELTPVRLPVFEIVDSKPL